MSTALITGAASLMGEGIARELAKRGWDLALTDINIEGLTKVADGIKENVRRECARMDVIDRHTVQTALEKLASQFGSIDALVNCAGGLRGLGISRKPLHEIPPEDWRRVVDVNLKGVLNVVHAVLPVMRRQGKGTIVSIAASRGLRGGPGASHYSAAKAGVILFTQTMVLDCASYGVRINTIAPGNADARWKRDDEGASKAPMGRPTSASDIAKAVAWLISDDASHVTGACIDISGGTTLH